MRQSICPPSLNGGSSRFCASIRHVPSIKPHPVAYLPFLFFRLLFVAPIVASKAKKKEEKHLQEETKCKKKIILPLDFDSFLKAQNFFALSPCDCILKPVLAWLTLVPGPC